LGKLGKWGGWEVKWLLGYWVIGLLVVTPSWWIRKCNIRDVGILLSEIQDSKGVVCGNPDHGRELQIPFIVGVIANQA
jgi:hypothetical protein